MKKIAIVTDSVLHGGIARVALTLLDMFKKNNYLCDIFTIYDKYKICDIPEININGYNDSYFSRLYKIKKAIDKGSYSHVLILTTGRLSILFSPFALFLPYKKFVCEHISFESYSTILKILKKITYPVYKNIIVLTSHDLELFTRNNIKTYCIHNPSPFECQLTHKKDNKKRYLAIGHLIPRKGYKRLLEIWENYLISGGEGTLNIVGDGPMKDELLQIIDDHHISRVKLIGSTKDMLNVYKDHDVLLCTAHAEGLPMTFIEAQSFSFPIISYDIKTGPSEIIIDGKNGFLIEDNNEEVFVKKMFLIENSKFYESLSRNSLISSNNYSYDKIFSKWSALFNE